MEKENGGRGPCLGRDYARVVVSKPQALGSDRRPLRTTTSGIRGGRGRLASGCLVIGDQPAPDSPWQSLLSQSPHHKRAKIPQRHGASDETGRARPRDEFSLIGAFEGDGPGTRRLRQMARY